MFKFYLTRLRISTLQPKPIRNFKKLYSTLIQDNANFNKLNTQDIEYFGSILQPSDIIHSSNSQSEDLKPYNTDWIKKYVGNSSLVLFPRDTEQVSKLLKYCNERKIAVVPQGGNTGLVGGSVPVKDEVIISLVKLNKIRQIDSTSGIVHCDAGCVLETLNEELKPYQLMMPIDLGAKGSCHIGGNLATNAGGLRLLRYGSLHGNVIGVEVVLADGTIIDNLSNLRKDNTGYHLKQLFIGSEGSLGIITGVSILAPTLPKAVNVALLGLETYDQVQESFKITRNKLGEILSAFEFIDKGSLDLVMKHYQFKNPLSDEFPFYVLIETHGSNKEHDDEKLNHLLEHLMEGGLVSDGIVAQDNTQLEAIWKYREYVPEAVVLDGQAFKYDFSVPLPDFYKLVERTKSHLKEKGLYIEGNDTSIIKSVVGFGHIGDSNLHLNIIGRKDVDKEIVKQHLEPFLFELVASYKGSISAEHGMGLQKAKYLNYSKSEESIELMKKIKQLLDPNGILNPYKVLP